MGVKTGTRSNAQCDWNQFDPDLYWKSNYDTLRPDDHDIIRRLATFFSSVAPARSNNLHGIDVGAGTNLYPALSMIPLVRSLTLREYSQANVAWLEREIRPYRQSWDPFWEALFDADRLYRRVQRPRQILQEKAKVEKASVFDLEQNTWDIGTMFFVAESITGIREEFERATLSFVRSLKPGSPFAAAFIKGSKGYSVGELEFPAVAIAEEDVRRLLRGVANVTVKPIESTGLRDGYEGMILATGTRK